MLDQHASLMLITNIGLELESTRGTRLIRLRAVDGYASDITRYSIDPSYNPHSYSPLVLQPTFDLWPWADLAQNLISSSTPGGASMYQVWWKSTQGFLRFRVNEVKIAYWDQVHCPLTLGGSRPKSNQFIYSRGCTPSILRPSLTLGGSRPKSNQFIYSRGCTPVPSLMKIHPEVLRFRVNEVKIAYLIRPSSLTFDLWHWADLAQNLISSSTPGGAPLYLVWWKSTQGFLIFRVNEVKIAYLDQVHWHWPLTLDRSRPKSNQFIYSQWCTPVPSLMKIHPGFF